MLDAERVSRYLERGTIEIAPIAFMRGRTLNDAFVILDEAQNTTTEQMKMFLTRLGVRVEGRHHGRRYQIDLPIGRMSGLVEAMKVVGGVEGISFVYLTSATSCATNSCSRSSGYESFSNGNGGHRTPVDRSVFPEENVCATYRSRRPENGSRSSWPTPRAGGFAWPDSPPGSAASAPARAGGVAVRS